MKTVAILAGLIALVMGGAVPHHHDIKLKSVDAQFVTIQKKVMHLFEHVEQLEYDSEYYKLGKVYDIEANIEKYTNKKAVEEFLELYRMGFMPKYHEFSVFYEKMRDQAIALFHVMYYAKDFETFYQTAAWAKVHLNPGQFLYAYYIAVLQRPDTDGIVLPAPYEVYPELFINKEVLNKIYYTKMQDGLMAHDEATEYGIVKESNNYVYYANYSSYFSYPNEEHRLSYFTEDVGLNAYYYYFHTQLPFWWNADKFGEFKERRGEIYFYFYQQLLARYYLERLSNGLGEIPEFSWFEPIKTGYYPHLSGSYLPFAQRSNYYDIHTEKNYENIRFLDTYEKTFFQYLQNGQFKAFGKDVDFSNPKSINFVGNYWQTNADLYNEDITKDYQLPYEHVARHVLGGSPKHFDRYTFMPSALDFYQTSLRDPVFYQLYQRIMKYFVDYKEYLPYYNYDDLHFPGVKINDVEVSELVTYFDHFDFNVTNSVIYGKDELKSYPTGFVVRQPRLNHKPFSINIDLKSDVASDAVFKIFLGPKYDSHGYPVALEDNWMKFVELDWFIHKLTPGANKVERKSSEFELFKEDSVPIYEIYQYLDQGKVPYDMSVNPHSMPKRLMLPKGTPGGFPFQLYVFVYPYNGSVKEQEVLKNFIMDNKPFAYPLDRPLNEINFKQPNMFFKNVKIYHRDAFYSYELNVPSYFTQKV